MDFLETLNIAAVAFQPVIGLLVIGAIVAIFLGGGDSLRMDDEEDYWFWAIK